MFGDRSTIELLLEITGRNDASGALRRAADDMAKLAARKDEINARQKIENDLEAARQRLAQTAYQQGLREKAFAQGLTTDEMMKTDAATRQYAAQRDHINYLRDAMQRYESERAKAEQDVARRIETQNRLAATPYDLRDPFTGRYTNPEQLRQSLEKHYGVDQGGYMTQYGNYLKGEWANVAQTYQDAKDAAEKGRLELEKSKTGFQDLTSAAEKARMELEKAPEAMDRTSSALDHMGQRVDHFAQTMNRQGVGVFRAGMLIGLPAEALGGFLGLASRIDKGVSGMLGPLGALSGPLSAAIGLFGALAGAMIVLPAIIAAVVAAWTALTDLIAMGAAGIVAFIPPVTLLVGLLGSLGAGFAFVTEQVFSQSGKLANARSTYHADLLTYQNDVATHARTTGSALAALRTARTALSDAERSQGFSRQVTGMTTQFDNIVKSFGRQAAPYIQIVLNQVQGLLNFAKSLEGLSTHAMFRRMAGPGVDLIYKDAETWGHIIGPIVADAIAVSFGSSNMRNKMVDVWTQLTKFFTGPHGALNPVETWFDKQHIEDVGMRWSHEFNHWINSSGLLGDIGQILERTVADAIKQGVMAGIGFFKTELTTLSGWKDMVGPGSVGGGTLAAGVGLGFAARLALRLGGFQLAGRGLAGGAEFLGSLGGTAALGLAGGAAVGGALLYGLQSGPNTSGDQLRRDRSTLRFLESFGRLGGPRLAEAQGVVQSMAGLLVSNRLADIHSANMLMPFGLHEMFQPVSAQTAMAQERHILAAMGITGGTARAAGAFSGLAGRFLAPNEVNDLRLLRRRGLGSGAQVFTDITRLLPGGGLVQQMAQYRRIQTLVAAVVGETGKLMHPHDLRLLTNIPNVALPAVEKLIEKVHGMPKEAQIKVTVKDAEDAFHKMETIDKHVRYLDSVRHQVRVNGQTQGAQNDVSKLSKQIDTITNKQHNTGKNVFFHPNYAPIIANARTLGTSIDQGIGQGLLAGQSALNQVAANVVARLIQAARSAGKISSPSQVAADQIGLPIVQGIAAGMLKAANSASNVSSIRSTMNTILQTMMSTFDNFKQQFTTAFGNLFAGPAGTGTFLGTGLPTPLSILSGIPGAKIPFSAVRSDLAEQLSTMKKFTRSVRELRRRYPDQLVQQVIALGPAAQPEIDALLSASRSEAKEYSKMFNEGQRLINQAGIGETIAQLDVWRHAGKGVAVGILAGLRSAEPAIENYLARIAGRIFSNPGHSGHHGSHHGMTVHQHISVNNASTDTVLRRSAWHLRNITTA